MGFEENLSVLSTIPEKNIKQLSNYINKVHSHSIVTQILDNSDLIKLEIFEGTIYLAIVDDTVSYKFIPNDKFNKIVVDSIINKKSDLIESVSSRLKDALINTYKDIL